MLKNTFYVCLASFIIFSSSCAPSRTITASGKVTVKGGFKAGTNTGASIATTTIQSLKDVSLAGVEAIEEGGNTVDYDESVRLLTKGLLAYSLDPSGPVNDYYVRYGIIDRLDAGYKYASGAHVLDVMYQFMGPLGTPDNPGTDAIYGSIGLQYSGQKSDLPSKLGLDKLSAIFEYDLSRKDILIPLAFSKSFGPEEKYGNFTWGLVYGHTFIKYGISPSKYVLRVNGQRYDIPNATRRNNFSSFGGFINAKIGYKYAYIVPALSVYHQNYGTYNFFGLQEESYKGMTFVPSLGLQFNINYGKAGKQK